MDGKIRALKANNLTSPLTVTVIVTVTVLFAAYCMQTVGQTTVVAWCVVCMADHLTRTDVSNATVFDLARSVLCCCIIAKIHYLRIPVAILQQVGNGETCAMDFELYTAYFSAGM